MLLYSRIKGLSQESYMYFWKGSFLLSLSMLIPKLRFVLPTAPAYGRIIETISLAPFIYGFYLFWKGIKTDTRVKSVALKKNAGFAFGIICLVLVPISGLLTLGLMLGLIVDSTSNPQKEWGMMIAAVLSGVLSVFLAVVGWRLFNMRKGWKGKLFSPYTLWPLLSGSLFLIVGFIKLAQRNLTGLWAIAIAIALIVLSNKKADKIEKTT